MKAKVNKTETEKTYVRYKGQKYQLIVIKALIRSGDKKDFWADIMEIEVLK